MKQGTGEHLERFYSLLKRLAAVPMQGRPLRELPDKASLPTRGVYFFLEPGEFRTVHPKEPRVVRVGTHAVSAASKSTLRGRLKQHLGTRSGGGNHRGSIFRLHIGKALLARHGVTLTSWGVGSVPPASVRNDPDARAAEAEWEQRVSEYIGGMQVLWIEVPDDPGRESDRALIERNAISLLSNRLAPTDPPSNSWLGRFSPREEIRGSGLWNLNYVMDTYDAGFLDKFESSAELTASRSVN